MSSVRVNARARESSIEATIIRADGRVERLGTVSYWHRNPLFRAWWRIRKFTQFLFRSVLGANATVV